ncbi:MAG TPA: hypothetical protein VHY37_13620, partial [Tepidisphaeraceae bacterium]|nr:hypothetical protein [Tepidisphaeraceae bacterium]
MDKPDEAALEEQVQILNYQDPNHFIIELRTKSPADRLILAKPPGATLGETIQAVEATIGSSTPQPAGSDTPF